MPAGCRYVRLQDAWTSSLLHHVFSACHLTRIFLSSCTTSYLNAQTQPFFHPIRVPHKSISHNSQLLNCKNSSMVAEPPWSVGVVVRGFPPLCMSLRQSDSWWRNFSTEWAWRCAGWTECSRYVVRISKWRRRTAHGGARERTTMDETLSFLVVTPPKRKRLFSFFSPEPEPPPPSVLALAPTVTCWPLDIIVCSILWPTYFLRTCGSFDCHLSEYHEILDLLHPDWRRAAIQEMTHKDISPKWISDKKARARQSQHHSRTQEKINQ